MIRPKNTFEQRGYSANHGPVPMSRMRQDLSGLLCMTLKNILCSTKIFQDTSAKFGSPQHSPLYTPPSGTEPVAFKKGDKCEWRILATHGEKIILNITSLDIPASANCHLDYLEVNSNVEIDL